MKTSESVTHSFKSVYKAIFFAGVALCFLLPRPPIGKHLMP